MTEDSPWFLMEFGLFGIPAILFGLYQLWSVKREIAKDKAAAAAAKPEPPATTPPSA